MVSSTSAPQRINNDPKRGTVLVTAIEEKVRWTPNETHIRYPAPDWEVDGYRTLTWGQFGDSVNKVAHWLDEKLGKANGNDAVSYFGPNDLRYAVLWPAVIKTGRKLMVTDGRVTGEGLNTLLEAAKCNVWISAEDDPNGPPASLPPSVNRIVLPTIEWCLDASGHEDYPYEKTWDEAKWDEILIIHTSGTTGVPKPIRHTNGWHACYRERELSNRHWPRGTHYDAHMGKAALSSCPPQWLGGLVHYVTLPVYLDTVCIIPPPDCTFFSPEVFTKLVKMNSVDGIVCPPHTIEQLFAEPDTKQLLKELQFIVYLGAALNQKIGDELVQHTKVVCIIGSTENGKQVDLMPMSKSLWYTHDFAPEGGARMVRIEGTGAAADGSEDLHELVIFRSEDREPTLWQAAFWNPALKDLEKIETSELYAPAKDIDGSPRWVFSARKDDLTKLEWLAKFHAKHLENIILEHPDVSGVLVGGEGRPYPYVIVEPRNSNIEGEKSEALLVELYQSLSDNNSHAEIHIPKETILITKPDKPLKRTFKKTLMRKEIEKDYNEEIEEVYKRLAEVKM